MPEYVTFILLAACIFCMYNHSFFVQNGKKGIKMSQAVSGRSQLRAMIVPAFATTIFGGAWLLIAASALRNPDVSVPLRFLTGKTFYSRVKYHAHHSIVGTMLSEAG